MANQDSKRMPPDIQQYFDTLPPMIQETLTQCGIQFSSREELETYAKNLMSGN